MMIFLWPCPIIIMRVAKPKFQKPEVPRKKIRSWLGVFTEKSEGNPGDFFIEIRELFDCLVSKKIEIFVHENG
jgi:hypothetical protein